jgi:protein gp37
MSGKTKIEWAEKVWNPVTGCTKISPGCANCYAERMTKRFWPDKDFNKVTLHPDRLEEPLRWKKPSRIFVCSMGDLFHEDVTDEFIDGVFGTVLGLNIFSGVAKHTFLILTKRPERMKRYFDSRDPIEHIKAWAYNCPWVPKDEDLTTEDLAYSKCCHDWDENGRNSNGSKYKPWGYLNKLWPLPNVWLGVTAENQQMADERIPILLQVPAAVRFVSVEPMLGSVDLMPWIKKYYHGGIPGLKPGEKLLPPNITGKSTLLQYAHLIAPDGPQLADRVYFTTAAEMAELFALVYPNGDVYRAIPKGPIERDPDCLEEGLGYQASEASIVPENYPLLDWVICGGESGSGARSMHPDWVRSLRDQCQTAGVPFFFKQWGEWVPVDFGGVYPGDICLSYDGTSDVAKKDYICFMNESDGTLMRQIGKKKAGRFLDDRTWDELPEVRANG